ncbi:hypothetical protein [Actinoplanes solisilvae]|uniref:hypothetical protein n=1 Tax=Actinoplanes solisilvae TaxID=2486853 RepID=UPI000FD8A625|nr:hypothetical protein [Actinoplanes solisilvae]
MTSLDKLKDTLERGAALAPDGSGLVEQARAGAVRLRHRNRMRAVAAVIVAVALVSGVPAVVRTFAAEPPPNPAGPMTHYREPHQLSLQLAPDPIYFNMLFGTRDKTQFLIVRPIDNLRNDSGATATAYDPGTFDPTRLRRGERVTVQGRPAFYVENLDPPVPSAGPSAPIPGRDEVPYRRGAAVGWQDPSGVWITVSEGSDRATMLRVAEKIRLTAPTTARTPVRFGWVPLDLPLSFAEIRDVAEHGVSAQVGFGAPADRPGETSGPFLSMPRDTPLRVSMMSMEGIMTLWGENYTELPMRTIAGHRTWYIDRDTSPFRIGAGSQMMIQAGSCAVTIGVRDRESIPYASLVRMVENMTFGGCVDNSNWLPIIGS